MELEFGADQPELGRPYQLRMGNRHAEELAVKLGDPEIEKRLAVSESVAPSRIPAKCMTGAAMDDQAGDRGFPQS